MQLRRGEIDESAHLRVEGSFEETTQPRIHLGDAVNVRLVK